MTFLWPHYLWLMLALPLLPLGYIWLLRRKGKSAVRYSSLSVVREASAGRNWRRHIPPALFFIACATLLFAGARPLARVPLPWARTSIILAMDVSLSMRVTDVKPNRLVAAQEAAKQFLAELPRDIEVGLVTFAGSTLVAHRITPEREPIVAAINAFQMQMGTAVGNAIVMSLSEIFPDHHLDIGDMTYGGYGSYGGGKKSGRSLDDKGKPPPKQITPVEPGSYNSAAIILLSDGRRTTGIDTLEAAKMAADRGVRVYVIGLGTVAGAAATDEGMPIYLQLDEPTMKEIARMTGGEYHYAGTAESLRSVYSKLGSTVQVQTKETELSGLLALVAALFALTGGLLSVLWFGRVA